MDPLILGLLVAVATIVVLFSGISVAIGLLLVAAVFLMAFDGLRSLALMPEIFFGGLDNFALLSIPMFIIMGASIASTRAGADLYEALDRWLTRVPGGLVISNLVHCRRRHAGYSDSPLCDDDCLWDRHRYLDRSFVSGRGHTGHSSGRSFHAVVAV